MYYTSRNSKFASTRTCRPCAVRPATHTRTRKLVFSGNTIIYYFYWQVQTYGQPFTPITKCVLHVKNYYPSLKVVLVAELKFSEYFHSLCRVHLYRIVHPVDVLYKYTFRHNGCPLYVRQDLWWTCFGLPNDVQKGVLVQSNGYPLDIFWVLLDIHWTYSYPVNNIHWISIG